MIPQIIILLMMIESGGDPNAVFDNGKAIGVLQIHKITVREANRLSSTKRYTYEDRWDVQKSIEICSIVLSYRIKHYKSRMGVKPTASQLMRSWNSGNIFKPCTEDYYRKVQDMLQCYNLKLFTWS